MTETSSGTHWEREDWCKLADRLLDAAMAQATPGHARIVMPGESGGLGTDVDGLEGFARVGLLGGTRLVGGEKLFISWRRGGPRAWPPASIPNPTSDGCVRRSIGRQWSRHLHWPCCSTSPSLGFGNTCLHRHGSRRSNGFRTYEIPRSPTTTGSGSRLSSKLSCAVWVRSGMRI